MASSVGEKRRYHRFAMSYPIKLFGRGGHELAASRTLDLSRGGALLPVPQDALAKLDQTVNVTVSLPEWSYRAEAVSDFACEARIVRREDAADDGGHVGVALEFARPMQLAN